MMKTLKTGLVSLCLLVLLSGCGVTEWMVKKQEVPAHLTKDEPAPEFDGWTNQDLLFYIDGLRAWGDMCYGNLEAIRKLQEEVK